MVRPGRELAGIVVDNWRRGRKRHVWVSISQDLQHDAQRDLDDVLGPVSRAHKIKVMLMNNTAYGQRVRGDGVLFMTYQTLIGEATKGKEVNV